MSDPRGKQPVKDYPPSHPSQLRNEITANLTNDERATNESVVQVPDSQAVIPETQYDLPVEHFYDDFENRFTLDNRRDSEQRALADEAFISRVKVSKNATTVANATIGIKPLERWKPKDTDEPAFSPFTRASLTTEPAQERAFGSSLCDTVANQQSSTLPPPDVATQAVDGSLQYEKVREKQFPDLSLLHTDQPRLPTVKDSAVAPRLETDATLNAMPRPAARETSAVSSVFEQYSGRHSSQVESGRPNHHPKTKKTKRRKPKSHRPDATNPWPLIPADNDAVSPGVQYTTAKGHSSSELQEKDASMLNVGQEILEQQPQNMNCASGPNNQCNGYSHHSNPQNQEGLETMLPADTMEDSPGPTPIVPHDEAIQSEQQQGSYSHIAPSGYDEISRSSARVQEDHYPGKHHAFVPRHDNELVKGAGTHEVYCGGDAQAASHNHDDSLQNVVTHHEVHGQENYAQAELQPEVFASHLGISGFEAQPQIHDSPTEADYVQHRPQFKDGMLNEKSIRNPSNRISKPRAKRCGKGSSASKPYGTGKAPSLSAEHEAILDMMATCLRAGDSKARDIVAANVKANETTIVSLQETIGQQNDALKGLRTENSSLQDRMHKMVNSTTQLQKYVKGMEGDYARLRGQAEGYHKTCDYFMKNKVHEFEQEKEAMKQDFSKTTEALSTSQRRMRAVMNDCYSQLMVSESKHQAVSEQLQKQITLYEDEKRRRSYLEQEVLPAIQYIRTSLGENHTVIAEKLGTVQACLDDTSAEKARDVSLKECLDALRDLQAIPMLTTKDLRKAEEMLRFVHESIGSKVSEITQSVDKIEFPTEKIQASIESQLCTLRADILEYDKMAAQHREAQQSIEHLHQQLEVWKGQCATIEESRRSFQQEATNLKARCTSLQAELESWKSKVCDRDSDPSELKQEIRTLRQQVEMGESDLQVRLTELEDQAREMASAKAIWNKKEVTLQDEIDKLKRDGHIKNERLQEIQDEKADLESENLCAEDKIRNMTFEVKELRETVTKTKKELEEARSSANEVSSLSFQLTDLRQQLAQKSEEAQLATSEATSLSSELTSLRQRLLKLSEMSRSKEVELEKLQTEHTGLKYEEEAFVRERGQLQKQLEENTSIISDLTKKINTLKKTQEKTTAISNQLQSSVDTLQSEKEQLTVQLTVGQSKILTLKNELDARDATHQNDVNALEDLNHQAENLRKEKQGLAARLGRSRANETKLSEAQAVYSTEMEGLQAEVSKLRASLEEKKKELRDVQAESAEESMLMTANHAMKVDELDRRIGETERALKVAGKTAEHKSRELEAHKKAIDEKFGMLVHEARRRDDIRVLESHKKTTTEMLVRDSHIQGPVHVHASGFHPQSQSLSSDPPSVMHLGMQNSESIDGTGTKSRKKPNRRNKTVLNVAEASPIKSHLALQLPDAVEHGPQDCNGDDGQAEIFGIRALDKLGAHEVSNENDISFTDPGTQETQAAHLTMTCPVDTFEMDMRHVSVSQDAEVSSSALSDPPSSDDLIDMAPLEKGTKPTKPENVYKQSNVEEDPREYSYNGISRHSAADLVIKPPPLSEERPKSQANTSSRVYPPPILSASYVKNRRTLARVVRDDRSRSIRRSGRVAKSGRIGSSSPDYLYRPVHNPKRYGTQISPPRETPGSQSHQTPRPIGHESTRKRKSSRGRVQGNVSPKRHRSSSRLSSSESASSSQASEPLQAIETSQPLSQFVVPAPRTHHQRTPQEFSMSTHGRVQLSSTSRKYTARPASSARSSQSKGGKHDNEFDAMFDRELQTGRSRLR